jgi:hypothetical protein
LAHLIANPDSIVFDRCLKLAHFVAVYDVHCNTPFNPSDNGVIKWCWTIHRHIINRGNTVCFDEKVGKHQKGKKECQGRKTLGLNVVHMGTIATLN